MIATVVEVEAMVITAASAVTAMTVVSTPMTAVMIGSPAATSEPKVISRMMKAMMSPTSSGSSEGTTRHPGYTLPLYSTCTPAA